MTSTIKYLDEALKKLKLPSDNSLAIKLGLTRGWISKLRNGKASMDEYTAARLAEILERPAIEIIATAQLERERCEFKREFWARMVDKTKRPEQATGEQKGIEATGEPKKGQNPSAHNAYYQKRDRRKFLSFQSILWKISGKDRRKARA